MLLTRCINLSQLEGQINLTKKEAQNHIQSCAVEAKKMVDNVQMDADSLNAVEREVTEVLAVWHLLFC